MKITNAFAFFAPLLLLVGCDTYPEHQSTLGVYTTPSQLISSTDNSTATTGTTYTPS